MESRHIVAEALASFDTAMMVTHAGSGPLDVRPMHIAGVEIEQGGPIWFVTSVESHTAMEVAGDARSLLTFQDPAGQYLAIWGAARVIDDRPRLRRLWRDSFVEWFPDGIDDPGLRLLAFKPHSAELWQRATAERLRYVLEPVGEHVRTNL